MAEASAAGSRALIRSRSFSLRGAGASLLVAWLVLAIFLNAGPVTYSHYRASHLVVGALLAGYALSLVVRRKLPGPTALDGPIAVLLVVNAAAVSIAPYRGISQEAGLEIAAMVVAFYALIDATSVDLETIVRAFVLIGALLAMLGVLVFAILYVDDLALKQAVLGSLSAREWLPKWYRPEVFYHPNILGSAMNLVLSFALALTINATNRSSRALAASACLLCVVTLGMTDSRGAWLGCLVAMPIYFLLSSSIRTRFDVSRARRWANEHKSRVSIALTTMTLSCGVVVAAASVVQPPWLFRATAGSRFDLFHAALDLIRARPLLGYGLNTSIGLLYPTYSLNHSHNQYLEILVGSGLIGLVAAAIFCWFSVRVLRRALEQQSPRRRAIAAACVAGLASMLVHGLVDVPLHWPGFVLLVAVVLVIAVRLADMHPSPNKALSYLARGAIVAIVPLCLIAWVRSDAAQSHYAQSLTLLDQGRLSDAASEAERAGAASRGSVAYQLNAGIIESLAYQSDAGAGRTADNARLERAIADLDRAAAIDGRSPVVYANLAQAERLAGNKSVAADYAGKALQFAPDNSFLRLVKDPSIAILAGTVLEWAGQPDAAVQAYAEAIRVEPSVAAAAYWSASPGRSQLRQEAVDMAGVSPCDIGRSMALFGGSSADLADLTISCRDAARTGDDKAALAIMLEAQGFHAEALQQAREAVNSDGTAAAHTALGYVLARDDLTQARREFLAGDKDGLLLLAMTYDSGVIAPPNLAPLATPQTLPSEVVKALRSAISRQPSRIASSYFTAQLRRAAPDTSLIPGDWLGLVPPRISLEQAIVTAFQ